MTTIETYVRDLGKLPPPMSAEEEKDAAVDDLITANMRFAYDRANAFANGHKLPLADCIQQASIGLCEAAKRFDPEKGYKFITYAVHWIRKELMQLAYECTAVRLPVNQIKQGAEMLRMISLDQEKVDGDVVVPALSNRLADSAASPLDEVVYLDYQKHLQTILAALPPKEGDMISLYYGMDGHPPLVLSEIGEIYGLSRERVRQVIYKAEMRVRKKWQLLMR